MKRGIVLAHLTGFTGATFVILIYQTRNRYFDSKYRMF